MEFRFFSSVVLRDDKNFVLEDNFNNYYVPKTAIRKIYKSKSKKCNVFVIADWVDDKIYDRKTYKEQKK